MTEKMISVYQLVAFSIDFEGSISCKRNRHTFRNGKDYYNYQIDVSIRNTSKELLEQFTNIIKFGYVINSHIKDKYHINYNWKDTYVWCMTNDEIRQYLPLIQPYIILKKNQIELAIEFINILKSKSLIKKLSVKNKCMEKLYTERELMLMEIIYEDMKEYNKKGRPI